MKTRTNLFLWTLSAFLLGGCESEPNSEPTEDLQNEELSQGLSGAFRLVESSALPDFDLALHPGNPDTYLMPTLTSGVIGDLDGDGESEIILRGAQCCAEGNHPWVYSFNAFDSTFTRRSDLEGQFLTQTEGPVGILDLNGDGNMDVLTSDTSTLALFGDGKGGFSAPSPKPFAAQAGMLRTEGLVTVSDLDNDGLLDILVGNFDCTQEGPSVVPVMQEGRDNWVVRSELWPTESNRGALWALLELPIGENERGFFASGLPCSNADPSPVLYKATRSATSGYPNIVPFEAFAEDAEFRELPHVAFGSMSLAHPMGATVGDVDQDGFFDLITTLDELYGLFSGTETGLYTDRTGTAGVSPPPLEDGLNAIGWGTALLDLDSDGLEDLVVANGIGDLRYFFSDEGLSDEPIVAFRNTGNFTFERFEDDLGLGTRGQWRSLTVGDISGNGAPDLLVGGVGTVPRIFLNEIIGGGNSLGLQLQGTVSNPHGFGARVEVIPIQGDTSLWRTVGHISSPRSLSSPTLFVGIGEALSADRVRVHWPSGYVQEVSALTAGETHTVVEPEWLRIVPSSRNLKTTSAEPFLVELNLPNEVGEPIENPNWTLKLHMNGQGFELSPTPEETGWTLTLPTPAEPGDAWLEIIVDGKSWPITPRVWWTE